MKPMRPTEPCLLCGSSETDRFLEDKHRVYRRCGNCALVFVTPDFHVSAADEKARYDEHNNDLRDDSYRAFLDRITIPIQRRFDSGSKGLDFGCGPVPLLAEILAEKGFEMEVFDPIYADHSVPLQKRFDFVVSTEVVEHLRRPLDVLKRMFSLVEHDGILAVMTRPYDDVPDFANWHYKNDRTHICFYSSQTFEWLASEFGVSLHREASDIFLFDRRNAA